jgi:hypothetical protein
MPTYNPIYLDQGPGSMYIPANPSLETKINPAMRDNVLAPGMTSEQWHAKKTRWSFSASSGTLESPFMMPGFELAREVNRILAVAWDNHGRGAVRQIILWIASEHIDECYHQLLVHGFERRGDMETAAPQVAFVGKPKRWRE